MQRCHPGGEQVDRQREQEENEEKAHDAVDDDFATRHRRLLGLAFRVGVGSGHWGPSRVLAFASAHLVVQESC